MSLALSAPLTSSTPSFSDYDPSPIAWQDELVDDVLCRYDYAQGVHQILLSGTVGSGKSLPAAHLAVRHCLDFPGSRGLIGRLALPDLKRTLFLKIKQHLANAKYTDETPMVRDKDYWVREVTGSFRFRNGSEIIGYSWADADWESFGSLELSFAIIEEATENKGKHKEAYFRLLTRLGRLPHVGHNWIMALCNPDGPSHWLYEHFKLHLDEGVDEPEVDRDDLKHVYYSKTEDNVFLPDWYIVNLAKNLDPKTALRLLKGRWVDISTNYIYHSYSRARNYRDVSYKVNELYPINISWDFNIGDGKPLSLVLSQYINDQFHYFDQVVIEGMRTLDSCEELASRGLLEYKTKYLIHGDATGKRRDTRSKQSDYEIILDFFANYKTRDGGALNYELQVPAANPPIRDRHNLVNGYCFNVAGDIRLFVYKDAPMADKGLRLTKPKDNGKYIEDDSDDFQHITTAIGYDIYATLAHAKRKPQRTLEL